MVILEVATHLATIQWAIYWYLVTTNSSQAIKNQRNIMNKSPSKHVVEYVWNITHTAALMCFAVVWWRLFWQIIHSYHTVLRPLLWRHNERTDIWNHRRSIVCSTICSGADQRKHQSSASQDILRGIHRRPLNYTHKSPVTRKMFPWDDVIMQCNFSNASDKTYRGNQTQ